MSRNASVLPESFWSVIRCFQRINRFVLTSSIVTAQTVSNQTLRSCTFATTTRSSAQTIRIIVLRTGSMFDAEIVFCKNVQPSCLLTPLALDSSAVTSMRLDQFVEGIVIPTNNAGTFVVRKLFPEVLFEWYNNFLSAGSKTLLAYAITRSLPSCLCCRTAPRATFKASVSTTYSPSGNGVASTGYEHRRPQTTFQFFKCFLLHFGPNKRLILTSQIMERSSNTCKILLHVVGNSLPKPQRLEALSMFSE